MTPVDLQIAGVTKRFRETVALNDISFTVDPGAFVSILGPSGCGKSTLLRVIAGLEGTSSGTIAIDGSKVDHLPAKEREIAFVFQNYALYPHLTVRENIAAPLVMREMGTRHTLPLAQILSPEARRVRRSVEDRVERIADLLELSALLGRRPAQLSGGQRQRVALGRALVREPKVLLMDEPLANLDAALRTKVRSEILSLQRRLGTTTIFVTHDQAEAFALSDKVAVMFQGELRQFDTPDRLYRQPRDLDVGSFLSQPKLNAMPCEIVRPGVVAIAPGRHVAVRDANELRSDSVLAFRPEHAELRSADVPDTIPATVLRTEHAGADSYVFLNSGLAPDELVVRVSSESIGQWRTGANVGVSIDAERAWVFPRAWGRIETIEARAA